MEKLLFIALLLINFISVNAQKITEYSPGYIIKNNNDTIYGELKVAAYSVLASEIRFKEKNDPEYRKLSPIDLKGFCFIPNTFFESKEIILPIGGNNVVQKYFVLRVVTGEINFMVCYLPNEVERFYISNNELGLSELKQTDEMKGSQLIKYNEYIFTLGKYMYKNSSLRDKIEKCTFNSKRLAELISEYNVQSGKNIVTSMEKDKLRWNISIQGSLDNYFLGRISYNGVSNYNGYSFGISNAFYLNKKFRETELIIDLNYRKNNFLYSYSQFEIPVYVKYNNKNKRISPIVEMGFNTYYMMDYPVLTSPGYYDGGNPVITGYPPSFFHISDKIGVDYIVGLGLGLNFKNLGFKYVIYTMPYLRNSFTIAYRIK